jgi:hypothetical protein
MNDDKIEDLDKGDWVSWDDGFACVLDHLQSHTTVVAFDKHGRLKGLRTIEKVTMVGLVTAYAANVPWQGPKR